LLAARRDPRQNSMRKDQARENWRSRDDGAHAARDPMKTKAPGLNASGLTFARTVSVVALCALVLGGCAALPRSGPLASQITTAGESGDLEGLVATLTPELAARVNQPRKRAFDAGFLASRPIDPDRLGVGDTVDVTIWEGGAPAMFGGSVLSSVRVEPGGSVFIPYAGRVRAAGATPPELRARIRSALTPLTLDPQIDVRLASAPSRMITVQGSVGRPGPYTLDRGALTLTPMLALAGGSGLPPEQVEVSVRRNGRDSAVMLEDIYADASLDIALRPADQIVLSPIRERFVALGATSNQAEITFPTRALSLLSAIGAARGLRDFDADPTGVFVFRREPRALADALLPGAPPEGLPIGETRPVVYRLDLTAPGAVFTAQTFQMRDGDALFATNAPLTELRKFLQLFSAVLVPVQQTSAIAP